MPIYRLCCIFGCNIYALIYKQINCNKKKCLNNYCDFRSVPDKYLNRLIEDKVVDKSKITSVVESYSNWLGDALKQVDSYVPQQSYFNSRWSGLCQAQSHISTWDTGVDTNLLNFLGRKSVEAAKNWVRVSYSIFFIFFYS